MTFRILSIIIFMVMVMCSDSFAIERTSLNNTYASFVGDKAYDVCGIRACIVGDINGDGYDDMLIGKVGNQSHVTFLVLVLGRPERWSKHMVLSPSDASIRCTYEYRLQVSGAGDVNGDGCNDILIGVPGDRYKGQDTGQTYVFFGGPTDFRSWETLDDADASFVGETAGDCSGISVSGAGDVNGDGLDDILIGAFATSSKERNGRAYLIFGKVDGWAKHASLSEADAQFVGPASWNWAGSRVCGTGDTNGDGYDDILIGAHWESRKDTENPDHHAEIYLAFGNAGGWKKDIPMSECGVTFVGRGWFDPTGAVYALLGWNMAGAGDVNGDGYDDMIVAAPWDDDGGNESGQIYLIFGREGEGGHAKVDLFSAAGASFIGEHSGERLGVGLDGGTDVNGDGYDDMIIGSSTRRNEAGETYLVLGRASGWAKGIRVSEVDATFYGEAPEDGSGWAISMGGDVNGDGFSDIFIGAGWNDFNGISSGQAYLQCRQEQKGDVDFDGHVDITDVVLAVNILLKLCDEPPGRVWAADVNDDGAVNVLDIVSMLHSIHE